MSDLLATAARIADEVLFAAAGQVEAAGIVAPDHLAVLAEAGLYGLFAPGQDDPVTAYQVIEILASGCLATTFVWLQHHSAVRAVAASDRAELREAWLDRLARGEVRAGVAVGGLRPGPPLLRVRPTEAGFELNGEAPWVTGWGLVDVLLVAARDDNGLAHWFLIDAQPTPGLTIVALDLLAVNASRTVHMGFDRLAVPSDRIVSTLDYLQWSERDAAGLRGNGSLALGLAGRCCRLLAERSEPSAARLAGEVDAVRAALDVADPAGLPVARAAASALAVRAATTLFAAAGAGAALAGSTPERLLREAGFLLVFGSRPAIRTELIRRLSGT